MNGYTKRTALFLFAILTVSAVFSVFIEEGTREADATIFNSGMHFWPSNGNAEYYVNRTINEAGYYITVNDTAIFPKGNIFRFRPDTGRFNIYMKDIDYPKLEWTVQTKSGTPTYGNATIGGFQPNGIYDIVVDDAEWQTVTADSSGVISFSYSEGWSSHTFETRETGSSGDITISNVSPVNNSIHTEIVSNPPDPAGYVNLSFTVTDNSGGGDMEVYLDVNIPEAWWRIEVDNTRGGSISNFSINISENKFFWLTGELQDMRVFETDQTTSIPYNVTAYDGTNNYCNITLNDTISADSNHSFYLYTNRSYTTDGSTDIADATFVAHSITEEMLSKSDFWVNRWHGTDLSSPYSTFHHEDEYPYNHTNRQCDFRLLTKDHSDNSWNNQTYSFRTDRKPSPPSNPTPSDGSDVTSGEQALSVEVNHPDNDAGAKMYNVTFHHWPSGTIIGWNNTTTGWANGTIVTCNSTLLAKYDGTQYFWYAKTKDDEYWSDNSSIFSFNTTYTDIEPTTSYFYDGGQIYVEPEYTDTEPETSYYYEGGQVSVYYPSYFKNETPENGTIDEWINTNLGEYVHKEGDQRYWDLKFWANDTTDDFGEMYDNLTIDYTDPQRELYNTSGGDGSIYLLNTGDRIVQVLYDGFEDEDLSEWTVSDSNFGTTNSYSHNGSWSAGIANDVADGSIANRTNTNISGGTQIKNVTWYYRETTNSVGGGIVLINSNGDDECGLFTDNPEWDIYHSGGITEDVYDPSTEFYDVWVRCHIEFNWSAGTFDYSFKRLDTEYTITGTETLRHGVNIANIEFVNYASGNVRASGEPLHMWIDDISMYSIDYNYTPSGYYISPDIDYPERAYKSNITFTETEPTGTTLDMYYNLSNDEGATWSGWTAFSSGTEISVEPDSQISFKAELSTTDNTTSPSLDNITIQYTQKGPFDQVGSTQTVILGDYANNETINDDFSSGTFDNTSGDGTLELDTHGSTNNYSLNYSLDFVSSESDYVRFSGDALDTTSQIGTIEIWVKSDATSDTDYIFGTKENRDRLIWIEGGSFHASMYDGSDSMHREVSGGSVSGGWQHVAFAWDITSATLDLYVDGTLVDSWSGGSWTDAGRDTPTNIGASDNTDSYWDGHLDDFRIWSEVRTQEQIQANMSEMFDGSETNLVAYYPMETGSGTTLSDSVGTDDGTINGASWSTDAPSMGGVYYLSGTRTSPVYTFSDGLGYPTTKVVFTKDEPSGTTLNVSYNISVDGGSIWSGWQEVANGDNISEITNGMNMSKVQIQFKQELSTTDNSTTPSLSSLSVVVDKYIHVSMPYSNLDWGTTYYWRTQANNDTYGVTFSSDTHHFTTVEDDKPKPDTTYYYDGGQIYVEPEYTDTQPTTSYYYEGGQVSVYYTPQFGDETPENETIDEWINTNLGQYIYKKGELREWNINFYANDTTSETNNMYDDFTQGTFDNTTYGINISEGFESGAFDAGWTKTTNFNIKTDRTYKGSYSAGQDSGNTIDAVYAPDELSGGGKPKSFTFYWQETTDQTGFTTEFVDSSGNVILQLGGNNPQWEISDGDGSLTPWDGDGYDRWIKYHVEFDWGSGEYTYTMKDLQTGHTETGTRSLSHNTNLEEFRINNNNWGDAGHIWFDGISVEKPIKLDIKADGNYYNSGYRISPTYDYPDQTKKSTLIYSETEPTDTTLDMYYNLSNDEGATWSGWTSFSNGTGIDASPESKISFKAELSTTDNTTSPSLDNLTIQYSYRPFDQVGSTQTVILGDYANNETINDDFSSGTFDNTSGDGDLILDGYSTGADVTEGVSRYNMETNTGSTIYDQWNGYDGSINGATWTSSKGGNGTGAYALDFDGGNDYVNFGDISELSTPQKFSISLWFKRDSDQNDATNHAVENVLLAKSSYNDNDNIEIGTDGSSVDVYLDTTDRDEDASSYDAGISNGNWYHLVLTYDETETGGETKLYIDGTLVKTWAQWGGNIDSTTSEVSLGVARPNDDKWGDFDGQMDEVVIFNYDLTETEVKDIYDNGIGTWHYYSTGERISPTYSFSGVAYDSPVVNINQTTPTDTTLDVYYNISTDGGNTWSGRQGINDGDTISEISRNSTLDNVNIIFYQKFSTSDDAKTPTLYEINVTVNRWTLFKMPYSNLDWETTYWWYTEATNTSYGTYQSDIYHFTTVEDDKPKPTTSYHYDGGQIYVEPEYTDTQPTTSYYYEGASVPINRPLAPTDPHPPDGTSCGDTDRTFSVLVNSTNTSATIDTVKFYWSDGTLIGTDTNIPAGSRAEVSVSGLTNYTWYDWYAIAEDGEWTEDADIWDECTKADDAQSSTFSYRPANCLPTVVESPANNSDWVPVRRKLVGGEMQRFVPLEFNLTDPDGDDMGFRLFVDDPTQAGFQWTQRWTQLTGVTNGTYRHDETWFNDTGVDYYWKLEVYDGNPADSNTYNQTTYIFNFDPPYFVDWWWEPRYPTQQDNVHFYQVTEDIDRVRWNFGDGHNSTVWNNSQHDYSLAGYYNVSLTVFNDTEGRSYTMSRCPRYKTEYMRVDRNVTMNTTEEGNAGYNYFVWHTNETNASHLSDLFNFTSTTWLHKYNNSNDKWDSWCTYAGGIGDNFDVDTWSSIVICTGKNTTKRINTSYNISTLQDIPIKKGYNYVGWSNETAITAADWTDIRTGNWIHKYDTLRDKWYGWNTEVEAGDDFPIEAYDVMVIWSDQSYNLTVG